MQTCIVHLIRNSLSFCSWKDRKPVAVELKTSTTPKRPSDWRTLSKGPWEKDLGQLLMLAQSMGGPSLFFSLTLTKSER
jgi:transposase-like protein